ncbi:DUF2938 family protein [Mangrovicoccus sp. HB161399]|uniref:DUF2938 family protein n=1 Tax=Mangrovicoccus sp. HB161399 TaxID=2720392 RepID=UPI001556D56F|nr:DUF2938 family protein [Mangrovicoccus sp. HB161399]
MSEIAVFLLWGIAATAVSDLWQRAVLRALGQPAPGWGSVGRWVLGFAEGRLVDTALKSRPARPNENAAGWAFHYLVGAGYGLLYGWMLALLGLESSFGAAVLFGIATLAGPMLLMKPAMGGGVFGLKAANPWPGMAKTVSAHLSFGIGLWLAALVTG